MKKLISFFTVLVIALVTLTSCDEDYMISYDLKGTWEGNMYTYYDFNGHTQKVSYTEIQFLSNPYEHKSGYGYWVDHFSRRPGDYYYSRIFWEVKNQHIYIDFMSEGTSIEIYDYKLNGSRFSATTPIRSSHSSRLPITTTITTMTTDGATVMTIITTITTQRQHAVVQVILLPYKRFLQLSQFVSS